MGVMVTLRVQPGIVALTIVMAVAAALPSGTRAVVGTTLYVDGKNGSDGNAGTTMAAAFKTIDRAARAIPPGSAPGWRVVVRGYTDYTYRERPIHQGWRSWGTVTDPIVFEAYGYVAGRSSYVKPIISGADLAPLPGQRWVATADAGVYYTHWPTRPAGFAVQGPSGEALSALFQDADTWLWNAAGVADLPARAATGSGGYWWDEALERLYVTVAGGGHPSGHSIEVIMRSTFYFKGEFGVKHITVRGFRVEHSDNGIALISGADGGTIVDNETFGNLFMGIHTAGRTTADGLDPSTGHVIKRNVASYNTVQGIKISSGTQATTVCDNELTLNALQGLKIQSAPPKGGVTMETRDVTVCRNRIGDQVFRTPHRPDNDNATGITVANGARRVSITSNEIWNNGIGIHLVQEGTGMTPLDEITIERNLIHDNRRFGLNVFDGRYGTGAGRMWARHNLYWDNYIGVMVDEATSNKVLQYETVFSSKAEGIVINGREKGTSVSISRSLVTDSGAAGVMVSRQATASLSYVGLSANAGGTVTTFGTVSVSQRFMNTRPAAYLSVDPAHPDFLMISASSYQRTAGPDGTPIGARY